MTTEIFPSRPKGKLSAISSKSDLHRIIIAAALSHKKTEIKYNGTSRDIEATLSSVGAMGSSAYLEQNRIIIEPQKKDAEFFSDCGESGSTLRFLLPVCAALFDKWDFICHGRLPYRPLSPLKEEMMAKGVSFEIKENGVISIRGRLTAGTFYLPGDVSSQFISGLLFSLPLLSEDSKIILTSPLQSKAYVDMTVNTLKKFSVSVAEKDGAYYIKGNQEYITPEHISAEGDWSNSAFFLSMGALSEGISIDGLCKDSLQGDKRILDILSDMGAQISWSRGVVSAMKGKKPLQAVSIDASQIPDLVPILAVVACFCVGTTHIFGTERLRFKECDRIEAVESLIRSLGGEVSIVGDDMYIKGAALTGGNIESFNDHRIAMSAAVAGAFCESETSITGAECVGKSYPDFFKDYQKLGGILKCHP